jgi:hypothetical protein
LSGKVSKKPLEQGDITMQAKMRGAAGSRGSAVLLSIIMAVAIGIAAIAALSWAVDSISGSPVKPKAQRFVAAELRDEITVLADSDPRSNIPPELLDQLATR